MKAVFLIDGLGQGGAERVTCGLSNHLYKMGVDLSLVTLFSDKAAYDLLEDIDRISLFDCDKTSIKALTAAYRIRKKMISLKPDVVIAFTATMSIILVAALLGTKIPVICAECSSPKFNPGSFHWKALRFILYPFAKAFVFQTEEARDYFSSVIKKRSEIIANPVRVDMPIRDNDEIRKEIVTVGRLVSVKNHRLLITAFSKICQKHLDYKLIIYGEGQQRANLEQLIDELDLGGRVVLFGWSADVYEEIKQAYMFVMSSDYEGLPNALLEAMAIGLPCVSTDCINGGARALISVDKNGIIVPRNDAQKLSEAMDKLIANPDYAASLGHEAVQVRNEYSYDIICNQWLKVMNKATK